MLFAAVAAGLCLLLRAVWLPGHIGPLIVEMLLAGLAGLVIGFLIIADAVDRGRVRNLFRPGPDPQIPTGGIGG